MKDISESDLKRLNSKRGLFNILNEEEINLTRTLRSLKNIKKLKVLQTELVRAVT